MPNILYIIQCINKEHLGVRAQTDAPMLIYCGDDPRIFEMMEDVGKNVFLNEQSVLVTTIFDNLLKTAQIDTYTLENEHASKEEE